MTSAPPPPSMVSLPEPVVIVLAAERAVTVSAVRHRPTRRGSRNSRRWRCRRRSGRTGGNREIDGRDAAGRGKHQRIAAGAAVDRAFGPAIDDGIVAAAGVDDVGAAAAVDRVVAGTAGDRVGRRRAGQR